MSFPALAKVSVTKCGCFFLLQFMIVPAFYCPARKQRLGEWINRRACVNTISCGWSRTELFSIQIVPHVTAMTDKPDKFQMITRLSTTSGKSRAKDSSRRRHASSSRQVCLEDSIGFSKSSGAIEIKETSCLANSRETRIRQWTNRIEGQRREATRRGFLRGWSLFSSKICLKNSSNLQIYCRLPSVNYFIKPAYLSVRNRRCLLLRIDLFAFRGERTFENDQSGQYRRRTFVSRTTWVWSSDSLMTIDRCFLTGVDGPITRETLVDLIEAFQHGQVSEERKTRRRASSKIVLRFYTRNTFVIFSTKHVTFSRVCPISIISIYRRFIIRSSSVIFTGN